MLEIPAERKRPVGRMHAQREIYSLQIPFILIHPIPSVELGFLGRADMLWNTALGELEFEQYTKTTRRLSNTSGGQDRTQTSTAKVFPDMRQAHSWLWMRHVVTDSTHK